MRFLGWLVTAVLALAGNTAAAQDDWGSIEGSITLTGDGADRTVSDRPPPFRTAIFLENVERDRWRVESAPFPEESPLVLRLTDAYRELPGMYNRALAYEPTVVIVEVGQYIQFKNPKIDGEWSRMGIAERRAEFYRDPAGPTLDIPPFPFGHGKPFGRSEENMAWVDPKGDLTYPPVRVIASGRITGYCDAGGGRFFPVYFVGAQNPYHRAINLKSERTFRMDRVPPGTYWLRTFDYHLATARQEVVVRAGETTSVEMQLSLRADPWECLRSY